MASNMHAENVLDKFSVKVSKSEIDLQNLPPTQVAIERVLEQVFQPVNSLTDGGPINFRIPGSVDQCIDPLIMYYLSGRLVKHVASGAKEIDAPAQISVERYEIDRKTTTTAS